MLSRLVPRAKLALGGSSFRSLKAFNSSFVNSFEKMVNDLPFREAVRYTKDNKKFTAGNNTPLNFACPEF